MQELWAKLWLTVFCAIKKWFTTWFIIMHRKIYVSRQKSVKCYPLSCTRADLTAGRASAQEQDYATSWLESRAGIPWSSCHWSVGKLSGLLGFWFLKRSGEPYQPNLYVEVSYWMNVWKTQRSADCQELSYFLWHEWKASPLNTHWISTNPM